MGTAFLGCAEAPLDDVSRAALSAAEADDVALTLAISGKAARGLRNRYVEDVESLDEPLPPYPAHYSLSRVLRAAALERGNADFITMWSGQGVGLFRQLPAAELVADLVSETQALLRRLGGT
jgi:nitronate monooxygenase